MTATEDKLKLERTKTKSQAETLNHLLVSLEYRRDKLKEHIEWCKTQDWYKKDSRIVSETLVDTIRDIDFIRNKHTELKVMIQSGITSEKLEMFE